MKTDPRNRRPGEAVLDGSAACPHRPPCPGCPRFGQPGIAPAAHAALEQLARLHGLPPVAVVSGPTAGFRLRARLAIRGRGNSPKLGLFALGTHRVVHTPHCSVQHPLINRVAAIVRRALVETRVTCYSDAAHLGFARYLQVAVERSSQAAQIVLVANSAAVAPLAECLDLIRERVGAELHSLWLNQNTERTNTILGSQFHRWCGPDSIVERFGGAAIHYPPGAFGQSNPDVAERIIARVREYVPEGARVAEYYAGVGAIGLSVLDQAGALWLNEINPHALHGLELGCAQLTTSERAKVAVVSGGAGTAMAAAATAQVVIADPPRKGLDPRLCGYLHDQPPDRFIYVSCGLDAFLADAARLTAGGALRLAALTAFNLVPFTEHVETVAVFDRSQ